jgi:hypothetical protein
MPTVPTVSGRQVLSTGVQAPAQQAFVSQVLEMLLRRQGIRQ